MPEVARYDFDAIMLLLRHAMAMPCRHTDAIYYVSLFRLH